MLKAKDMCIRVTGHEKRMAGSGDLFELIRSSYKQDNVDKVMGTPDSDIP